jgi:hypothetical protein
MSFAAEQAAKLITSYELAHINDIVHEEHTRHWFYRLASGEEYSRLCGLNNNYKFDRLVPSTNIKSRIVVSCSDRPIVKCKNITRC